MFILNSLLYYKNYATPWLIQIFNSNLPFFKTELEILALQKRIE